MCTAFLDTTNLNPGLYPTDPQGHTLVVGQTTDWGEVRAIAVLDFGGVITIGGVEIHDPDLLDQLAERLHANAANLRHEQTHPYRPGLPGVAGCPTCGHRAAAA